VGLLDTTLEVAKLAGKVANPELVQEAMKANAEALAMSRENLDLLKRVAELESQLGKLEAQVLKRASFDGPVAPFGYMYRSGDRDHPLCPKCLQSKGHLESYLSPLSHRALGTFRTCPICDLSMWEEKV
jgi:hypothetical protein